VIFVTLSVDAPPVWCAPQLIASENLDPPRMADNPEILRFGRELKVIAIGFNLLVLMRPSGSSGTHRRRQ
jgi:hypothetical protein